MFGGARRRGAFPPAPRRPAGELGGAWRGRRRAQLLAGLVVAAGLWPLTHRLEIGTPDPTGDGPPGGEQDVVTAWTTPDGRTECVKIVSSDYQPSFWERVRSGLGL